MTSNLSASMTNYPKAGGATQLALTGIVQPQKIDGHPYPQRAVCGSCFCVCKKYVRAVHAAQAWHDHVDQQGSLPRKHLT
jgi:hypothetical protein